MKIKRKKVKERENILIEGIGDGDHNKQIVGHDLIVRLNCVTQIFSLSRCDCKYQ